MSDLYRAFDCHNLTAAALTAVLNQQAAENYDVIAAVGTVIVLRRPRTVADVPERRQFRASVDPTWNLPDMYGTPDL